MKKKLKKGFTLVELVIVIAVIAILSAVLIPTFSNVIGDAKESAAKSDVINTITQYTTNQASHQLPSDLPKEGYIILFKSEQIVAGSDYSASYVDDKISYVFYYNNGKLETVKEPNVTIPTGTTTNTTTRKLTGDVGNTKVNVNLKIDGLTVNKDETTNKYKTWKADGTVVLDGKVEESTGILTGKVVLLTVKQNP